MLVSRKMALPLLLALTIMLVPGCPNANGTTFPYYIMNLTMTTITELKLIDGGTMEYVNILTSPVPANTMRIVRLSRAKFENSLSEIQYKLGDATSGAISARISNEPGELGFVAKFFNNGNVAHLFVVDNAAKSDQLGNATL